jgi:hypothetical protein
MFLIGILLCLTIFHSNNVLSLDCEYSSREYQVVFRPSIMLPSFKAGLMQVVDKLTKIKQTGMINFKISASSLKLKNVSSSIKI